MSQDIPSYITSNVIPTSLEAFKNRLCAKSWKKGYAPPSIDEITALIKLCGWSQEKVANITGVTFDPESGSSTVRKWQAKNIKERRTIPYAAWRLLLMYAGVVDLNKDIIDI